MNKTLDQILVDYQIYCKSIIKGLNFCEIFTILLTFPEDPFLGLGL